jgi:hypothetical protein
VRKGKIWTLALIVLTGLELLVLGYTQVAAQAPAVAPATTAATVDNAAQLPARERAPSGNTSQAAQQYYDYIYGQYLKKIPTDRTQIMWSGPFWIAFWAITLILFFFFYSYFFQRVHREAGELYAPVSFAGAILERIGSIALLSKLVWTFITLSGLYYIITHILWGQVY